MSFSQTRSRTRRNTRYGIRHALADNWFFALVALGVLAVIGLGIFLMSSQYRNPQTHTACVVEDKDRTTNSKGGSNMRVYTSCGVFTVQDMLFAGEFDSADKYASLDTGKTYTIDTTGYRIPLISSFPVIREVR